MAPPPGVRVPLPQIEQVTVRQIGAVRPRWWWRLRGTDVPGVIRAGSFVARGGRELWDVRQGAVAVDIALAESAPFRRIRARGPGPRAGRGAALVVLRPLTTGARMPYNETLAAAGGPPF